MEMWAPAQGQRPRRRAGQPSFSSTLLDAICDAMDDKPAGATTAATATERAAAAAAAAAKKQREGDQHCSSSSSYYYNPALAASHRAARAGPAAGASADDCPAGRGYFSSSEVEYSLRRLRPVRTSGGGRPAGAPPAEKREKPAAGEKARRATKPAAAPARGGGGGGCRRPASPGARLASLLNAIFTGRRNSARQHPAPEEDEDEEPACSTAPPCARPCLAKTQPPARAPAPARARRSRCRTVRFLDIDGEVAVAAATAGCRRFPVVEVEEVQLRPSGAGVGPDSDGGEESSDASSDLFELESLAATGPTSARTCGDELPVYGTTGVGLRHDTGRRRPFGYGSLSRSYSRVV
ncbi:hypothetical protein ACP4OV_010757 [Aristida adscensionis]